jgi:hypothetical protein
MIRLPRLTPRQMLIVVHDLVATAAAILAAFYVRFEEKGLVERWDGLISFLPLFVVYAGIVYFVFGCTAPNGVSPRCPTCRISSAPRPCSRCRFWCSIISW